MSRPTLMTDARLSLLRLVQRQPRITAAVATRTLGSAVGRELSVLARLGHVRAESAQQINGQAQRGYLITDLGAGALRQARAAKGPTITRCPAPADGGATYTCPELGRTCQRPGAYDAFEFPSLIQGRRVWPKGARA